MESARVAALAVVILSCCALSVVSGAPTKIQIDGQAYNFPEEWEWAYQYAGDEPPSMFDEAPATDAEVVEPHVLVRDWKQACSQAHNTAGAFSYGQAGGYSGHDLHQVDAFVDNYRTDSIGDTLEDHTNAMKAIETRCAENPDVLPIIGDTPEDSANAVKAIETRRAENPDVLSIIGDPFEKFNNAVKALEIWRAENPHTALTLDTMTLVIELHDRIACRAKEFIASLPKNTRISFDEYQEMHAWKNMMTRVVNSCARRPIVPVLVETEGEPCRSSIDR